LSSGTVIGEVGYLKQQQRAASVSCETFVSAYHLSTGTLDDISSQLEARRTEDLEGDACDPSREMTLFQIKLWKSWGFKVASKLFHQLPQYDVSY
jgi:hypothetical protein